LEDKKLAKKKKREVVHLACLRKEFTKMKEFLDDDEAVFITFLNTTNYHDSKNNNSKVMIKMAIEKAGD